jgi:hypothetical protein
MMIDARFATRDAAQTGDALIGFVAIDGPIVREPTLHPMAGTRAEKETCRHVLN